MVKLKLDKDNRWTRFLAGFWLLPNGGCWPENGEIDIMEQWGSDGPTNTTTGAAHAGNGCQGSSIISILEYIYFRFLCDDYHLYSIIWYENYIGWYVDNELKHFITPQVFQVDLNGLIIQIIGI